MVEVAASAQPASTERLVSRALLARRAAMALLANRARKATREPLAREAQKAYRASKVQMVKLDLLALREPRARRVVPTLAGEATDSPSEGSHVY